MKKYDSYKDSGIEWIGDIPSHWEVILFKRTIHKIKDGTHGTFQRVSQGRPFLSAKNVYDDGVRMNETESFISEEDYSSIVKNGFPVRGDLLITCVGTIGRTYVYDFDESLAFQRSVTFIRFVEDVNPQFYKYYVQSSVFQNLLTSIAKTSAQSGIYMGDLVNTTTLKVPVKEQTTIANFLDQKTTQIDDLIAKKERLIQLLEEERTAIINQAVTKGLDPNVPMKDSGIEWLGEIPEHWGRARIKTLVKIKVCDGPHETPEWKEDGIPFISAEAIKGNQIDLNFKRGYISEEQHKEYCKKSKVLKGDILFCKSGSTTGKSALVEIDDEFGIWSPLAIIRADERKISNRYMFQSIQSSLFRNQVETSWTFGTQPNIGMGALENLWIAIPPLNEQESIDEYLISELKNFDVIIAKTQQEIELLKEYKTALISEVVTGKVDVSTAHDLNLSDKKFQSN